VREKFVEVMVAKGCESDFIDDAKKRWARAEFSSVTKNYLTIGDVTVKRPERCILPEKHERDLVNAFSESGRSSVTFDLWAKMRSDRLDVRMKINGERFVVTHEDGAKNAMLQGFKDYKILGSTTYHVLEYYAGKFYSLFPVTEISGDIHTDQGVLKVLPHPYIQKKDIQEHDLSRHRYDGVMIQWMGDEYRAKWKPTGELLFGEDVWEVSYDREMHLQYMRSRPGKTPSTESALKVRFPSEICGRDLVPLLFQNMDKQIDRRKRNVSSKVIFFDEEGMYYWYLEEGKRWDFVGGQLKAGETPISAAVREVEEEIGVRVLPSNLIHVGEVVDHTPELDWISHLFIAFLPFRYRNVKQLFSMSMAFTMARQSAQCRPRQVWVDNVLRQMAVLGTVREFIVLLTLSGNCEVQEGMVLESSGVRQLAVEYYMPFFQTVADIKYPGKSRQTRHLTTLLDITSFINVHDDVFQSEILRFLSYSSNLSRRLCVDPAWKTVASVLRTDRIPVSSARGILRWMVKMGWLLYDVLVIDGLGHIQ